jgi:adenylyltransferase/sulfurtransferase
MELKLKELEEENKKLFAYIQELESGNKKKIEEEIPKVHRPGLTNDEISRYSRHLLLPEIGVKGQEKICRGSVLVVGAGGLGSPCLLYLAASGVGRIGIVDFDKVDKSNLHRQIIHTESREGLSKAISAKISMLAINSKLNIELHDQPFNEVNGLDLVKDYDVVIDASDNVTTRYLVNDACVLSKKPLVSGSAVRIEGQLTVYNYKNGPCYRCLFPRPPPPETVTNCSDGGVLGVVPGIIGSLQALEALKILMDVNGVLTSRLLTFNGMTSTFRNLTIRSRQSKCEICGDAPIINSLIPYEVSCAKPEVESPSKNRIAWKEYMEESKKDHLLLDVRASVQFAILSFPNAMNIPLDQLETHMEVLRKETRPVYVVCRRGIASMSATRLLLAHGFENVVNIDGGYTRFAKDIDSTFPTY